MSLFDIKALVRSSGASIDNRDRRYIAFCVYQFLEVAEIRKELALIEAQAGYTRAASRTGPSPDGRKGRT